MFKTLTKTGTSIKREIKVYQFILKDYRTPKLAKTLLGFAVGYTLLPFDIIPDFIPIIGYLDDIILVPALVIIALKLIPKEIIQEARKNANQ